MKVEQSIEKDETLAESLLAFVACAVLGIVLIILFKAI